MSPVMTSRARLGALALAAVVVAACGGGGTPAPAASAGASAGASGSASSAAGLAGLTSYKFKVVMASTGVKGGFAAMGSNITVQGTAIVKPTKASDTTMTLGLGNFRVVQIADKQWVDVGGGLIASTDTSQSSMADSFNPETLANSFMVSGSMKVVGDETKNGVACTHMQADTSSLGGLATAYGIDGTWSDEVWVAKDGGYPVSSVVKATGTSSGQAATFTMSVDVTDVNNPANVVTAPS